MFRKTPAFRAFFWIFIIMIGGFVFLPLLWMINTAIKPSAETFTLDFFTGTKALENIIRIVTDEKIMGYLKNSLIVSFGSSAMATAVCAMAAYSFSKFRYTGRKFIMGLFMMSQAFPQAILLLSIYLLMQKMGLLGSYWALLISYVVFTLPVGTWTLKSYFDQLPDSLIESAKIDGAGNLKIMLQIVFPITVPGMISIAIYGFVWSWNDLLYYYDPGNRHSQAHPGLRLGYDLFGGGVHQLGIYDGGQHCGGDSGNRYFRIPSEIFYTGTYFRSGKGVRKTEFLLLLCQFSKL